MPEETVGGMEFFVKEREVRLLQEQKIIRHPGPAIDKTKQKKTESDPPPNIRKERRLYLR